MPSFPRSRSHSRLPIFVAVAALLALCALIPAARAAAKPGHRHQPSPGALVQLKGARGCLVDRSAKRGSCGSARALAGAGAFMGSRAIAISPDGRDVYVASSDSDAIAIFARNRRSGTLTQPQGAGGCISAGGSGGCASAVGLDEPNSLAISPDGRNVYATSRAAGSVTTFLRNPKTGALIQLPAGAGCASGLPILGCAAGRALVGPDVVVASADGRNVYVGSFFGNAVAVFDRNPVTGSLTQPEGSAGCIAAATSGCATGIALGAPEGMAISADGSAVYVATAVSNALVVLARDPATGALAQASDGSGCIADAPLAGCATGFQIAGANAVAVAGNSAFVTSLLSGSVTSFQRSSSGVVSERPGPSGCVVFVKAVGCGLGRALAAPEGIAVSPDGANVYAAAFGSGAIAVLDRRRTTGTIRQKPGRAGCVAGTAPGCSPGRALKGVSSLAISPDGRFVYATANKSDAVDVFRRR
jgi:DNA-binding beta-propeller fold protein YncE